MAVEGEAAQFSGARFVRARCVAPGLVPSGFDRKFLWKLSEADWQVAKLATRLLKVLQALLTNDAQWKIPIIDCCQGDSVIISQVNTGSPDIMNIAEFFTGRFRGWAQGAYILHRLGITSSVRWGIEKDPSCFRTQEYIVHEQVVVRDVDELQHAATTTNLDVLILADVSTKWWTRMFQYAPTNALTVSAPCQPWSTAARESGLQSESGRIMLRVADIAATFLPTVVMLEQVAGFASHEDFPSVMNIWDEAGYEICWKAVLELVPCNRNRLLMVLRLRGSGPRALPAPFGWECRGHTS